MSPAYERNGWCLGSRFVFERMDWMDWIGGIDHDNELAYVLEQASLQAHYPYDTRTRQETRKRHDSIMIRCIVPPGEISLPPEEYKIKGIILSSQHESIPYPPLRV